MKRIVLCCFIISISILNGLENKSTEKTEFKNGLGIAFSSMSGSGITYHRFLDDKLKVKFTNFMSLEKDGDKQQLRVIIGNEWDRYFYYSEITNTFFFAGMALDYDENKNEIDRTFRIGAGVGADIKLTNRIKLSFDLGYRYKTNLKKKAELGLGVGFGIRAMY